MVKFYLISIENGVAKYEYYPEGYMDKEPGIILFDTASCEFVLEKISEKELPYKRYGYAAHAKWRIRDLFKEGTLPEKGMVAWY